MSTDYGDSWAMFALCLPFARLEVSNLTTGITPPFKPTDVHFKLKFPDIVC
jgi:hypothetical protein